MSPTGQLTTPSSPQLTKIPDAGSYHCTPEALALMGPKDCAAIVQWGNRVREDQRGPQGPQKAENSGFPTAWHRFCPQCTICFPEQGGVHLASVLAP